MEESRNIRGRFPLGSVWYDRFKGRYGRVVGYPSSESDEETYVGMCYFNERGRYICYGAGRVVDLALTDRFPRGFKPKGEPWI